MSAAKHTPGPWNVRPAWTRSRSGEKRCGWHLMNGADWSQTYALKRDAQAEADKQNAAIAKPTGSVAA